MKENKKIKTTLKHINIHPRTMTVTKDNETAQRGKGLHPEVT